MRALNRQGKAPFAVSCAGHEGVQVGSALALRPGEDWVLPYYRDLGVMLVLGLTAREAMLQFLARAGRPLQRRAPDARPLEQPAPEGASAGRSPVGTQILHATGVALASKLKREPHVTAVYFGEGSTAGGDFHEAPQLRRASTASRWSSSARTTATPSRSPSAQRCPWQTSPTGRCAYGMPGQVVDGNDVLARLRGHARRRRARPRTAAGPPSSRPRPTASSPTPATTTTASTAPARRSPPGRQRDPLDRFRRHPARSRGADAGGRGRGDAPGVSPREVDEATDFAERSVLPDPTALPATSTPSVQPDDVVDVALQRAA